MALFFDGEFRGKLAPPARLPPLPGRVAYG